MIELSRTRQDSKAGQNRTEQNRTEQNRTEQNRTEQNRTEQNRTEQIKIAIMYIFYSGAWPVLIDEFVEFAKPLVRGRQTSV